MHDESAARRDSAQHVSAQPRPGAHLYVTVIVKLWTIFRAHMRRIPYKESAIVILVIIYKPRNLS